ncbi:MAG: endo alpha-1,4 polygalactosaminidase [Pseudomonadales bacterium]
MIQLLILLLGLWQPAVLARTAFFYGTEPPIAELGAYDRVVLDPNQVDVSEVLALKAAGVRVHAYVSVGEIEPADPLFGTLPAAALPGTNPAWRTRVADLSHPAWRTLLLETRLAPLSAWGYDGVFLDTLDSHHLLEDREHQRQALIRLIGDIQRRYPDLELMLNRGFEVLADLPQPVAAVAVESLYQGWSAADDTYRTVSEADRDWLLDRLDEARAHAGEIVVIDYAPHQDADRRAEIARRIQAHGFDAWVAEPALTDLGTSDLVPVPRRVVVLHRQADALLTERDVHVMFGVVFDWLGYVVEYRDVMRDGPPLLIPGVHAGVVTWLEPDDTDSLDWFEDWLLGTLDAGYRLAVLATLPTYSTRVLDRLGLARVQAGSRPVARSVASTSDVVGQFEAPLRLRLYQIPPVANASASNEVSLEIGLEGGSSVTPVVQGAWGGMALHPYIVEDYGNGRRRWLLDPYQFLARALAHEPRPVFDTTTENGSRLLTVHVDGDGFPSLAFLPGSPLSAEVLMTEFLETYDVPHTISVIEGEVATTGLYPDRAAELEAQARAIFRHPNVEIASHSYSHPFYWRPETVTEDTPVEYGMNLPIPGYRMSLEREIDGSIDYINRTLAPPDKQVAVFLWTGSADPDRHALDRLEARGLVNVNGGNTVVIAADESLLNVWPQARLEGNALQVYAPAMNENVYTNNWTGPFYGYRKAVETFELTDKPRRLKPISIYYHFYSATKPASIRALHEVYRWALAQEVLPVPLSGFAERVRDYHRAWLYRDLDGNWVAGDLGSLRTLRLPAGSGFAVPLDGALAGQVRINDDRYLHLSGESVRFALSQTPPPGIVLARANARIARWHRQTDGSVALRFSGALPVVFSVHGTQTCTLTLPGGERRAGRAEPAREGAGPTVTFELAEKDTGDARLVCR